jgi:tRNA(Ile2) C34 agmatinyltransferase TiaS
VREKNLWIIANLATVALFWAVDVKRIVDCDECGQRLAAPPQGVLSLRCPKCGAQFEI